MNTAGQVTDDGGLRRGFARGSGWRCEVQLGLDRRHRGEQVLAVGLGQGADGLGDDRVDGRQLPADYLRCLRGEVDEDLAPVGGVGVAFDQAAAFEGVD